MKTKKIEKNIKLITKQIKIITHEYLENYQKNDRKIIKRTWKNDYVLIIFYLLVVENLFEFQNFYFGNDLDITKKIIDNNFLQSYLSLIKCENNLPLESASDNKIIYNFNLNNKLDLSISTAIKTADIFIKNIHEIFDKEILTKSIINNLESLLEKYSIYYIVNKNAPQFEVKIKDNLNNELNHKIDYTKFLCNLINEIHIELRKIFVNKINDLSNYINLYSKSLCAK